MQSKEAGYFRLQHDFCSMGDNLLGVEFDESERLQTSISDSLILSSCAGSPWKSDLFRMEVSGQPVLGTQHEYDTEKHASCNLKDLEKFPDISSCSFEEILSDGSDGIVSTLPEKVDKFELTGKNSEKGEFKGQNELGKISPQGDCSDTMRAQKRSRKPTQRYIDELEDSIPRFSKKRQGTSSVLDNKNLGVRGCKKRCVVSSTVALPVEETSVIAIQVPFAAVVVPKECRESEAYDLGSPADCGKLTSKPKQNYTTTRTSTKGEDGVSVASVKKRTERLAARQQKKGEFVISASQKKKNDFIVEASPIKRDKHKRVALASDKKKDDCYTVSRKKKKDEDFISSESPDEVGARRKHHILWTIEEVRKLLDGVSKYGVGKWSRIKKLLFSTSSHRTCVDLKDKWRNLLKASGILERGNRQGGKKRNVAWRPLPESIIGRVCELAAMYPYPKDRMNPQEMLHNNSHDDDKDDDSSDTSTDLTLNHYRKILRSISDN